MSQQTNLTKPSRKDFVKLVVISSVGTLVDEAQWKAKYPDLKNGALKKALAKDGMTVSPIFMSGPFQEAKKAYYEQLHGSRNQNRSEMISGAFKDAGHPASKRVTGVLNALLPLYKKVPAEKAQKAFAKIIDVVATTSTMNEETEAQVKRGTAAPKAPKAPRAAKAADDKKGRGGNRNPQGRNQYTGGQQPSPVQH